MREKVYTVSELNKYLKMVFEEDTLLNNIAITGEITNFKAHYTGHLYFTLKDETSNVKCVMFKGNTYGLKFNPQDGMKVIIYGNVSIYEANGTYQIYCKQMEPDGLGALYLAYEQLKQKLELEGLFDSSHKKKLPFIPKKVGIITSKTGAVIKDIINVTSRRFVNPNLLVYPAATQGSNVASTVIKGITVFNKLNNVDVIIIARGGGSFEDLFGFNDENLARAIYDSKIPIISAVGHETDFTICDFVSDLRVPTPSAAAEVVYPMLMELKLKITNNVSRENIAVKNYILRKREYVERIKSYKIEKTPLEKVNDNRLKIDSIIKKIEDITENKLKREREKFEKQVIKLETLSPLKTLVRGYSIARSENDLKVIKSVNDVKKDDNIIVTVTDGEILAKVI